MHNTNKVPRFALAGFLAAFIMLVAGVRHARTQPGGADPGPAVPQGTAVEVAVLVGATQTSQFDPPSPDPSGLVYLPGLRSLLIADSEVNEIDDLFMGANLFEVTPGGELLRTRTTLPYSDEPTGITLNEANGHFFVSDDTGTRGYYEVEPGLDGFPGTDQGVVRFVSSEPFGAMDPEGIAFDSASGRLYIADGADGPGTQTIYVVDAGANGIFDGVAPDGDDEVSSFDALTLGIRDPEGLAFNRDNGRLYILSGRDHLVAETLPDGTLVRLIDVTAVGGVNLAGLAYGPASDNPAGRSLYLVDRGEDSSINPQQNDGMLYEVSFDLDIDNLPPFVHAGQNQIIRVEDEASLEGASADDGNPNPPGIVISSWAQVAGAGMATFADPSALQTTVSFSAPGTYILRLTADDGELRAWDDLTITVLPPGMLYLPVIVQLTSTGE